jgi:heme exporter protein A
MLEVKNITYERDELPLIRNLSFSVQSGSLLIIKGENGQGKTTLLKLLAGILFPHTGEVCWANQSITQDPDSFYKIINYIGHKSAVALPLTPEENLYFASRAYTTKGSIPEALSAVNLLHKLKTPASFLSAGQVRRIALAKLFLLDTSVWILDEPYTALDVRGVAWLQAHIEQHLQNNGIVIMTSHQAHGIKIGSVQEIQL